MKRVLIFLLLLVASLSVKAQTFTFECLCTYVTTADGNCDICTTSGVQSRLFKGLLIRKNGVGYKWIDQPYIVQIQNNNATFRELIPNGETVTIGLLGTPYATMSEYKDSIKCPCAGTEAIFVAGPGINISGDTISAVDTSASNELQYIDTFRIVGGQLQISLSNDSMPYLFVTLPVPDGSETIVTAGTGIGVAGNGTTGTPYIVTNTGDLSATNEGLLGVGAGGASSSVILSNTSGAVGVTVNVTGIATISESTSANGGSITIGAVEVDGSVTNEAWTIDADDADTELITTQTVKFQGGGIVVTDYIPGTDILTITGTEVDGSTSNEVQTISASGAGPTSYNIDLNLSGGSVTLAEGTGIDLTRSTNTITITNSSPDQTVSLTGGGITVIGGSYPSFTITSTEVDGLITNEGILGVGAGGASSSTIISNTSTSAGVTINVSGILSISESTSSNGGSITITATEVDGSITNELQTISVATGTVTLSNSGGSVTIAGGGINTIGTAGTTITVTGTEVDGSVSNEGVLGVGAGGAASSTLLTTTSGGNAVTINVTGALSISESTSANGGSITINGTGIDATTGYINGGNSFGAAATIGLNDNFDWTFETNGTTRGGIDNAGTWTIGSSLLTTAQLNVNTLGSTNIGMLISGGGSLVGPNFYQATGSGTGSTATVLSGSMSMISGNVESIMKNTATAGTGGGALFTVNVTSAATTNDAFYKWEIDGVTVWTMGIDNDDVDNMKLHRFDRPSANNGQGTIEIGYRTNDIGIAINKTGIGTGTNGFWAVDVGGKMRTDQYANNSSILNGATVGTIALGTAAGTSPTVDNTVTSVWGNGARLKFTSGSSPTANGVICTITLDTNYTFGECASGIFARSTNASGFGYSSSFNTATRVITFTLNGTLTASTVYEFNIIFGGEN